jgi:hypothetical protein
MNIIIKILIMISVVIAFIVGCIFSIMGTLGLFLGSNAKYTLPPILGVIPLIVGIGIIYPMIKWWKWNNRVTACSKCGKERFDVHPGKYICECSNIIIKE